MLLLALLLPSPSGAAELPTLDPAPVVQTRRVGIALGGGLWRFDLADGGTTVLTPTVSLAFRRQRPVGGAFALEGHMGLEVNDFQAIGSVYRWYGQAADTDDETLAILKYAVLWPGLFIAPLFGANLHQALLLDGAVPVGPLALHIAGGVHAGLLLRPSEPGLLVDLTFGVTSAVGLDLAPGVSLDVRGVWQPPFFHTIIEPEMIDSYSTTLSVTFWATRS